MVTRSQLLEHLSRFLGQGQGSPGVGSVAVWTFQRPEFATVATVGLSEAPVAAILPQELVCSVLPDQVGAAHYLVTQCLQMVLGAGRGLVNEDVIPNDGILLAGTEITGVLVGSHPLLDDAFNVVGAPGSSDVIDLMTVIPLTRPEVELAQATSVDALLDRLEQADPPLLDITRPPAW